MARFWTSLPFPSLPVVPLLFPLAVAAPLSAEEATSLPLSLTQPTCIGCAITQPVWKGLKEKERDELKQGKVLIHKLEKEMGKGEATARVVAMGIIPRPPALVWKGLFTFSRWHRFLPNLEEARVTRVEGERLWLWHRLKVLFVPVEYTVVYRFHPEGGRAEWELDATLPHDIEETVGYWGVEPLGKEHTLLIYTAYVRVGRFVPKFVEDLLTRESLPRIVEGVRKEVLARFPEPGKSGEP